MSTHLSALVTRHIGSRFVGEVYTCLGIDIQAARGAPGGELLRIDISPADRARLPFSVLYDALGLLAPSVIGDRQEVRVLHDFENARIILADIPGDSDRPHGDFGTAGAAAAGSAHVEGSPVYEGDGNLEQPAEAAQ